MQFWKNLIFFSRTPALYIIESHNVHFSPRTLRENSRRWSSHRTLSPTAGRPLNSFNLEPISVSAGANSACVPFSPLHFVLRWWRTRAALPRLSLKRKMRRGWVGHQSGLHLDYAAQRLHIHIERETLDVGRVEKESESAAGDGGARLGVRGGQRARSLLLDGGAAAPTDRLFIYTAPHCSGVLWCSFHPFFK